MRIVLICGSRNPGGKTAAMADALLGGASNAGAECKRFFLPQMTLERCRQCDNDGWGMCLREGRCVIEDDFDALVVELRQADLAFFATPVYFGDLSESMRAFLDRLRRVVRRPSLARKGIAGKRAVGVCVAGGAGGGAPACAVSLERILNKCGFDLVDLVPVRHQRMERKRRVLEALGRSLAAGRLRSASSFCRLVFRRCCAIRTILLQL